MFWVLTRANPTHDYTGWKIICLCILYFEIWLQQKNYHMQHSHYANDLHCAFCNGVSDFTFFMGNFQRKYLFCDFSIWKWGVNEWLLCNRDEWKLLLTSFFLPLMKKVLCTSFWQIFKSHKVSKKKAYLMSKHRQPVTFWHVNQIDLIWENIQ